MPIDIYRAKATKFSIIDGKLMPPLNTIEGMGDKAAVAVEEASKDGPYLSKDDFRQRTKASKTVIDLMDEMCIRDRDSHFRTDFYRQSHSPESTVKKRY